MAHAIGELSYISGLPISMPLHRGWAAGPELRFVPGRPGELDQAMADRTLAAGPISSLEYCRNKAQYTLLPDLSISSWGRIGSSALFSRTPFSQLGGRPVALAPAGATSNELIKWLLARMFGVEAAYEEAEGPLEEMLERYDAVLLIGDQALIEGRKASDLEQLDLGEAWWRMMQTPLVHTVWACQADLPEAEKAAISELFTQAKAQGKAHHAEIVEEASRRLDIPAAEIEAYYALLNFDRTPIHDGSLNILADSVQEFAPTR
ncbi:MAG: menaquinone biosynthetic enzyme MqnA/MqnD family protein [Candidatus Sericytochromatia bacterium]